MSYKKMLPLVLAALLLWTVPASAAPETTLKVAVGDPEDSEMGVVGHAFKKYVEEKTGGKVEVQCFYGGSLGDESEAFRNVQKGTLPLAMGGIANLVPFEKKLGLLTLPYLFANIEGEGPLRRLRELAAWIEGVDSVQVVAYTAAEARGESVLEHG